MRRARAEVGLTEAARARRIEGSKGRGSALLIGSEASSGIARHIPPLWPNRESTGSNRQGLARSRNGTGTSLDQALYTQALNCGAARLPKLLLECVAAHRHALRSRAKKPPRSQCRSSAALSGFCHTPSLSPH